MNTRWKMLTSLRFRLLLGFVIVLMGTLVYSFVADKRPIGARAMAWAAGHTDVLPQTLGELAAYPAPYRREILKALPPERQSQLWRTQLRQFAADRPNLTAEQRSFVQYAIDVTGPESFQPGANPPELCERIAQLFPKVEDRHAFTKLASATTPTFAWRPAFVSLTERVRAKVVTNADERECGCRGSGFCECPLLDVCESEECTQVEDCGCIFVAMCTKVCNFILAEPASAKKKK
jgi:hypothetical protein